MMNTDASLENCSDILFQNLSAGRGNKVAIYCEEKTTTYAQLAELANRSGNALKNLGIKQHEPIMMLLNDKPTLPAVFFGGTKAGYLMAVANPDFLSEEIQHLINVAGIKAVIIEALLYNKIKSIRQNCPTLEHVIVVGAEIENTLHYETLIAHASCDLEPVPTKAKDPAFLLFTSGSTGYPKGAIHKHQDMRYTYESFGRHILGIKTDDIVLSVSKMYFAYGLGNSLTHPYSVGASTILLPIGRTTTIIFEHIDKYRPTILFSVPSFYNQLLHDEDAKKHDLSSIRLCFSAGEKLPPTVALRWKEMFGLEIIDGLGSTEMLHTYLSNSPGKIRSKSIGQVVPGYEIKLVDAEGQTVKPGEHGVMMVRGGSSSPYYLNNPEKTDFTMRGDWIYTSDQFYQDEEGYFYFEGRADDMFKVGGIWVSPVDVEHLLMGHPAVNEVLVTWKEDESDMIQIKAQIVLKPTYPPSESTMKDIQKFIKLKIVAHKRPHFIEFVNELQKTSSGKKKRTQQK